MLPGFVGQQSAAAADTAAAAIAGASAASGHAGDVAAVPGDVAAAFDSALSSACATSSAPAGGEKTGCADKSGAASSPTFPAWILALGLDVTAPDTDGAKGGTPSAEAKSAGDAHGAATGRAKTDHQEADKDTDVTRQNEESGVIVDVSSLTPPPVIVDTPPPSAVTAAVATTEDSPLPAELPASGHNVTAEEASQQRTSQSGKPSGATLPNTGVKDTPPQRENDDLQAVTVKGVDAPALKNEDSDGANAESTTRTGEPRPAVTASADVDGAKTNARRDATAAPAPANDGDRIVAGPAVSVDTTREPRAQAPRSAAGASQPNTTTSRGNEALKPIPVATAAASESVAEAPSVQNPSAAAAAASIATGEAVQETRRSPAAPADLTEAATMRPVASTTGAASVATGGREQSFQHAESDSHARNAGPEPPAVSRSLAWSTAMTLVSAPDGTLRLASPLATSLLSAPTLLEPPPANLDQMVQTMRVMVKDGVSEATVHLNPEHFGEVSIQVRVDGKTVSAIVHTESAGVREWLQGQESTLRSNLSEQGLQLDRLVVQRDGRQDRRHNAPQQQGQPRRRTRTEDDSQQTFELSV
jgi:flagellar hook-length control protein FliK